MRRRRFLRVVPVGATLAGCLSSSPSESTPTSTPPIESQVTVPDCPDKPDPLTRENVAEFALQFEGAYLTREVLDDHYGVTEVYVPDSVDDVDPTVTETEDGFVVRFTAQFAYSYRPPDATRDKHVDEPLHTANYFVSQETVLRAESGRDDPVDPRERGRRCSVRRSSVQRQSRASRTPAREEPGAGGSRRSIYDGAYLASAMFQRAVLPTIYTATS